MNASPIPRPPITVPARKSARLGRPSPSSMRASASSSRLRPASRAVRVVRVCRTTWAAEAVPKSRKTTTPATIRLGSWSVLLRKDGAGRGRYCYMWPQVEHVVWCFHRLWQHAHQQERDYQEEQVDDKHEPRWGGRQLSE